jgi:hypothetical protein
MTGFNAPEPATFLPVAGAGLGLLALSRSRRKRNHRA